MGKPYVVDYMDDEMFLLDFKDEKIFEMDMESRTLTFIVNVHSYLGHVPYILDYIKKEYAHNLCKGWKVVFPPNRPVW